MPSDITVKNEIERNKERADHARTDVRANKTNRGASPIKATAAVKTRRAW